MSIQVELATYRKFGLGNLLSMMLEFCNKRVKKALTHTFVFLKL